MTTKDDGGPAFPMTVQSWNSNLSAGAQGMTLRDYFAGQALTGISNLAMPHRLNDLAGGVQAGGIEARAAYALADAMLAARKEGGGE